MNDPWDVKCVRQAGQYTSCMKINGVPLLPPVLSRECRKEMQYYKLLAQEVEKRINTLKVFVVESDTDSLDDKTDAPELPDLDQDTVAVYNSSSPKLSKKEPKAIENSLSTSSEFTETCELDTISKTPSKFVIDLSISLDNKVVSKSPDIVEVPERDWDCTKPKQAKAKDKCEKDMINADDKLYFSVSVNNNNLAEPLSINFNQDGPPSLTSKSFTGSLNNIHMTSVDESQALPLSRQRSYTILKPSPMLLAHLEVQSINTGVEINSISMSESMSNLSSPNKKRRSWDLESAKVKWSSMALELKQSSINTAKDKNGVTKSATKKPTQSAPVSHARTRSLVQERNKRTINIYKPANKTEPIQKVRKSHSPVRTSSANPPQTKTTTPAKPITNGQQSADKKVVPPKLVSESEDPAAKVRELYEKIQKQQLLQMASLVEKQKKEQMLLQQVFEEQNSLLYSQLKTICPKPHNDIKEAWGDKDSQGPVSLSQLINPEPVEKCVASTLTETNNYLNHCDNILKKSRDITGSIKKVKSPPHEKSPSKNLSNGSVTRTHSPTRRNVTSRKLTYENSASSDRDYDLLLTDRTNDTMADLNVTFPSDNEEHYPDINLCHRDRCSPVSVPLAGPCRSTDRAIKSMEETIQNSIKSMTRQPRSVCRQPTPQEIVAATKIVAHVKGYLVRRLMKTERVQSTVQTIKDALLCALQLHQEREGIRGADVDLHRRLIQQITAACYTLHDTFIASTPAERCAMISADRGRRRSLAARPPTRQHRPTDI